MSAEVITMGCRLNGYESDVITENLKANSLDDVIVINSCAVTAEAVRQAKQTIRRLSRENPDKKIIVTGCAAQTEPETFAYMPEVAKVLGNHEKLLSDSYKDIFALEQEAEKIFVNDIMSVRETAGHIMSGFSERVRAYLQIQNGCDHRCTFCIIPYGRGNSRSVPSEVITEQVKRAVDNGIKEIVLTGVDITSWGNDFEEPLKLGDIVEKILKDVPELPRLRLSSIDSIEVDPKLQEVISFEKRFMPHLHLSLQAGDNMILKRMKRRHSSEQALDFMQKTKEARPEMVFGADIIAGFPTETDEMFENTANFLKDTKIIYPHIFPFSPRIGTPAAKMPQLEKKVIKERARILREIGQESYNSFLPAMQNTIHQVIIEQDGTGRSENFMRIHLLGEHELGQLRKVNISAIRDFELYGEVVS